MSYLFLAKSKVVSSYNSFSSLGPLGDEKGPEALGGGAEEREVANELNELYELSPLGRCALDEGGDPASPCAGCGHGSFYRAPGEGWRCLACEPAALPPAHEQAGWAFCSVSGGVPIARDALPYPPGWRRPDIIYLDQIMPDPETAPIGKCAGCRFTAPLASDGLCGKCVWDRAK